MSFNGEISKSSVRESSYCRAWMLRTCWDVTSCLNKSISAGKHCRNHLGQWLLLWTQLFWLLGTEVSQIRARKLDIIIRIQTGFMEPKNRIQSIACSHRNQKSWQILSLPLPPSLKIFCLYSRFALFSCCSLWIVFFGVPNIINGPKYWTKDNRRDDFLLTSHSYCSRVPEPNV